MFPVIECSVFRYYLLLAYQTLFATHSLIENFDVDIFYILVFMKVDLGEKKICEKKTRSNKPFASELDKQGAVYKLHNTILDLPPRPIRPFMYQALHFGVTSR